MAVNFKWLSQPGGFLKLIAFILMIICVGLFFDFGTLHLFKHAVFYGFGLNHVAANNLAALVISSTTFILFYYLISYLFGESNPGKHPVSEAIFLFVHAILAIASGLCIFLVLNDSLKLKDPVLKDTVSAYAVLVILAGIVILIDAIIVIIKLIKAFQRRNYF